MKGIGYIISIISVFLLAMPPLKSASKDPVLLFCLIGGATASIIGMVLRWLADRQRRAELQEVRQKANSA